MASGAAYLSSIYGTEKDKVNCSFYFKIGACRHGEKCARKHIKPTFSPTIVLYNVFTNPAHNPASGMNEEQVQQYFDLFYEDMWVEIAKRYGEIEELHICDNVSEHLLGNVYVKFKYETDAQAAVDGLNDRYYAGKPLFAELSPVTDFREACCRQYEVDECTRGGFCNFMHVKEPTPRVRKELRLAQRAGRAFLKDLAKSHRTESDEEFL